GSIPRLAKRFAGRLMPQADMTERGSAIPRKPPPGCRQDCEAGQLTAPRESPNTRSTLRRRRRVSDPMAAYDRLPAELRLWLAQATLPWSAQSALRVWRRALRACDGDVTKVHLHLTRIERKQLCKDVCRVWGNDHPATSMVSL